MAFDIEMIKAVYSKMPASIAAARSLTGKALTLTEKILYSHLWEGTPKNTSALRWYNWQLNLLFETLK